MKTKTLADLEKSIRIEAEKAVEIANGEGSLKELDDQKKKLAVAVANYNKLAAEEEYKKWSSEGNPVLTGLRTLYVPAKRARIAIDNETEVAYAKVESAQNRMSLTHLQKVCGAEHFADGKWLSALQLFCLVLSFNVKRELDQQVDDSVYNATIKEARETFGLSPDADMASNNSCLKGLQTVVDRIIFEEAAEGHGCNKYLMTKKELLYMRQCLINRAKKPGKMQMASTMQIIDLVADVLYCSMNGEPLELLDSNK